MKNNLKKLVLSAVFAAIILVVTLVVQIPSPMNGYVNLGDGVILVAAWVLGPVYGAAAAGIGSMLADIMSGYAIYAPGTLVIKALIPIAACGIYKALGGGGGRLAYIKMAAASAVGEIIMVAGYFLYAAIVFDSGFAAAAGIPGNIVQGALGVAVSLGIITALGKVRSFERDIWIKESVRHNV